jgi:anaerobic magnesium-protoporphyrin IX monomethyl ester cyclase
MKVLLLLTSLEIIEESYHDSLNAAYPLGLAYLHAYLEHQGHQVETLDLSEQQIDACEKTVLGALARVKPDVVGFQMLTSTRASSLRIAKAVCEHSPRTNIVLGGVHASEMWKRLLLAHPDYTIVMKEAEISFAGLLAAFERGTSLLDVPGLALMSGGQPIITGPTPVAEDLDVLPFPRHDLFITPSTRFASLMTSRGCPFTCSFCSVARRPMRFRSVGNVVDEIEYIAKTFPQIETIRVWDDQFFYKVDRVIAICDEIVRRGIKMQFICLGRMKPLSKDLVLALERAGFIHVLLGLESGSAQVLERCNKKIKPADALSAARYFAGSSIDISMFLIVGLEGETRETVLETAELVQKIQEIKYFPGWSNIGIATIYPGTDLYDHALQAGWMQDDYWDDPDRPVPLFTVEQGYETLEEFVDLLSDHIDPLRILTSPGAYRRQKHLIPQLLRWLYRNHGRTGNPYRDKKELTPFLNLVARVIQRLEAAGDLSIGLGPNVLRQLEDGMASLTSIRRQNGHANRFVLETTAVSREQIVTFVVSEICANEGSRAFEMLCSGIDDYLAEIHAERTSETVAAPAHLMKTLEQA